LANRCPEGLEFSIRMADVAKARTSDEGLGYREPLNAPEQGKRDDDGLNVGERIHAYAAAWKRGEIASIDNIFVGDLRSRFRWYGLYTQRPEEDGYFMLRIRIPGGVLTSEQTRTIGRISEEFGQDVADVTDRQNVQLHWIRLYDIPEIWDRLHAVGLTTQESCGDVPRNILGCPLAGVEADEILDATDLVYACNERVVGDPAFSNLPRKYKTSITGCRHQCAVHEANDLSFVGIELDDGRRGFDVWVGGGLSSTPHFAQRLGVFVPPEQVVEVFVGVTAVFRDYGYRRSRNKARLKFLVKDWGPELFRRELEEEYLGYALEDGPPAKPSSEVHRDHTGVGRQHDGLNSLGFPLRNGRITGTELQALADLADELGAGRLRSLVEPPPRRRQKAQRRACGPQLVVALPPRFFPPTPARPSSCRVYISGKGILFLFNIISLLAHFNCTLKNCKNP
jgi:sulfite reductase (ferredoxin)